MLNIYLKLQNLLAKRDEEGASAVEYGLLVAAIAAVIVVIVFVLGDVILEVFTDTCTTINAESGAGVAGC